MSTKQQMQTNLNRTRRRRAKHTTKPQSAPPVPSTLGEVIADKIIGVIQDLLGRPKRQDDYMLAN